jgi:hypothetical protein
MPRSRMKMGKERRSTKPGRLAALFYVTAFLHVAEFARIQNWDG